ncbi:MAG: hypothetical protein JXB50_12195 [Spirochaetes bacterium]|nr:hypothetical protein [Spirochaetota bacterium]
MKYLICFLLIVIVFLIVLITVKKKWYKVFDFFKSVWKNRKAIIKITCAVSGSIIAGILAVIFMKKKKVKNKRNKNHVEKINNINNRLNDNTKSFSAGRKGKA